MIGCHDGRLEAIWVKCMKRGAMDSVKQAKFKIGVGIIGNANQRGRRQVTIIEREVWSRLMNDLNGNLSPSSRRANLLISGLSLKNSRNRILSIGSCRVRIFGETKPCDRMEEVLHGLERAMTEAWAGGAFGEVLDDGDIWVGDFVSWKEEST